MERPSKKVAPKKNLSKKEAKQLQKQKREIQKQFVQMQYARLTGDQSGTVASSKQLEALKALHRQGQVPYQWMSRVMMAFVVLLMIWWVLIISSFPIDSALRLVTVAVSLPAIYLVSMVVAQVTSKTRLIPDGRGGNQKQTIKLPLFGAYPVRLFLSLFSVIAAYFIGRLFSRISSARPSEELDVFELMLFSMIPAIVGLVVAILGLVMVPQIIMNAVGASDLISHRIYLVICLVGMVLHAYEAAGLLRNSSTAAA